MVFKRWRKAAALLFSLALIFQFSWMPVNHADASVTNDSVTAAAADNCPITAVCGPAPHIEPKVVNEHAGEKILFDNTHGQTAGSADWVINGGFSDFANGLAADGYEIQELRQTEPITYDDLKNYDVFVVPEANIPYKQSEQAAMIKYVKNGGSIFFIADHYNADRNKNRWDASEVFNGYRRGAFDDPTKGMSDEEANSEAMQGVVSSDWLAENFGVRFRYNAIGDVVANKIVAPENSFGITKGVDTVAMHSGSTLAILDPKHAKGIVYLPKLDDSQRWSHAVDQGIYNGGGIAEGPFAAISKLGQGKAAFIGDSSPVEDATPIYRREDTGESKTTYNGFQEQDDATLLVNLVEWLSVQEDYTSFEETDIPLDEPTQLHDFEIPENSEQPEPEPWAPPEPGYEWWNPETFAPGSYGSGELAVNPTYSFVHQDQLPA
ncbi:MAG TPA: endonuclease, partial [Bacillales bacterium]